MPAKGSVHELELLDRIAARVATRPGVGVGIGDDAAVLTGDPATVAAHDLLVEDVHFRRATSGMADVGHRALAVNLSDLAAMGADPVAALVGLGVPRGTDPDDLDALYDGMERLAGRVGATIAGGDISRAGALVLAVTALGRLPAGRRPVLRSGARPGDAVCVTGALGGSAAGLALLEDPATARDVPEEPATDARRRHRRPEPRLAEGRLLAEADATAMIDLSDGLGLDALRLARGSGVALRIDADALPLHPAVRPVAAATGRDPLHLAAGGGEDFELLVTLPAPVAERVGGALPAGLTTVGTVEAGPPAVTFSSGGRPLQLAEPGYLHHV